MASADILCSKLLNVKNAVIESHNFYNDANGVTHLRIKARPNAWHQDDCPFCRRRNLPRYDCHDKNNKVCRCSVGICSEQLHQGLRPDGCMARQISAPQRCVDPFHVVEWAMDALDEVRKDSWRAAYEKAQQLSVQRQLRLRDENYEITTLSKKLIFSSVDK